MTTTHIMAYLFSAGLLHLLVSATIINYVNCASLWQRQTEKHLPLSGNYKYISNHRVLRSLNSDESLYFDRRKLPEYELSRYYDSNVDATTFQYDFERNQPEQSSTSPNNEYSSEASNNFMDYDHVQPPLALPLGEKLDKFTTEKKTRKPMHMSELGKEDGDAQWWRANSNHSRNRLAEDKESIQWDSFIEHSNRIKIASDIEKVKENELADVNSINGFEPDPIYLPTEEGKDNPLYTSLVDMINVAESLRVKRPSQDFQRNNFFNDGGHSENDAIETSEQYANELEDTIEKRLSSKYQESKVKSEGMKNHHLPPHAAEVQDSGFNTNDEESDENDWVLPRMGPWDPADTPIATTVLGLVMLFLILVVVLLALRVHCRNSSKQAQEWIRHPMLMVTPSQPTAGSVQPILHNPQTEPIRIKAKGLLERRGSNTSLTLDLGSDTMDNLISQRECTSEEFLQTAGNRLSRRALRDSLRDPRLLHAQFWEIPSNSPDRCSVPGSASKNRYRTVLPNEETRVILKTDSGEAHPTNHYINANYIKGYDGEEKAYIATQGPLTSTIGDFWRMVLQEKARAVVMITKLSENKNSKCEPYLPTFSSKYGDVQVIIQQVTEKNGYTVRQIQLKRGDMSHSTLHFWFSSWPDHKTPTSARHLLAMSAEVHATRKAGEGPAVVHCSAGIGRTGCFIGISIGMRQLLEEGSVDVLAVVCQMRMDRGGMVQTAEQYEFIHRALALYEASMPPPLPTD